MTATYAGPVYFDPFDQYIKVTPYPVYRWLRDEQPPYYNFEHNLGDVWRYFGDWEVDSDNAKLTPGYITRGWATLPIIF